MISLVGLGTFCSKLVRNFKQYEQYSVYCIEAGNVPTPKSCKTCEHMADKRFASCSCNIATDFDIRIIPNRKNAEEFEKNFPDSLKTLIVDDNKEITLCLDGSEAISGITLQFLHNFKDRAINIYYIQSDPQLMSATELVQDKISFNVLQEYTRSGLFQKFVLVDKLILEKILVDITVSEYDARINELISSTLHMINVYDNIKPLMSNNIENSDISRITACGLGEIGSNNIRWFADLENIDEIKYYFAINSDTLKKERSLLNTIKSQVKQQQKQNVKICYSIYETNYEQNFVYCTAKTKIVQQWRGA